MSAEVVMPQMGESIAEGTVSKWLKKVGDKVEKDEPILEISTDKVDAEVPAPASGIILDIRVKEGETVPVGTVVAVIGEPTEATQTTSKPQSEPQQAVSSQVATASTTAQTAADTVEKPAVEKTDTAAKSSQGATKTAEVVMPQMGESIAEGTVSKWLKKVGDKVEKDEPILEISTDKVDAEVPAPTSGVVLEIRVKEGETVPVGTVVAVIGQEGAVATTTATAQEAKTIESKPIQAEIETKPAEAEPIEIETKPIETVEAKPVEKVGAEIGATEKAEIEEVAESEKTAESKGNGRHLTVEELRRKKSSPLVRSIAKKHGIDISKIQGTGISGRVTKKDILAYIESGAAFKPQDLMAKAEKPAVAEKSAVTEVPAKPQPEVVSQPATPTAAEYKPPTISVSVGDRVEPMSIMRKKIAEHMVFSKRTSAHVTTVYEIDMTNVAKFREQHKAEFQARYGTKLTYMPFIFQAVVQGLRKYPILNAQVSGDQIIYKGDINLGMAVALDWGLIVPVIKKADTLSLAGLAITANDLADRARAKKLSPDEVQGGTFTVTNPGVFGGLFGTPIINQPQVAILCVGVIEKRPKVITTPDGEDVIAIRQMAYFALTYDHRIIDGADAEKFLSFIKQYLETTKFSL